MQALVKKEFLHVFRDPKTLLLLLGMPVVQIVLFGFALSNEIKNTGLVVCNPAGNPAGKDIVRDLCAGKRFYLAAEARSINEIEDIFKKSQAKIAVVFPPELKHQLLHSGGTSIQLIADASDPNTALTLIQYASSIIGKYAPIKYENISHAGIQTELRMIYNPELRGVTNFVPGVMALVLLLICVLMTSVSIVREKETGTMEILLVSPLNPLMAVISKAVPYFLLSLINVSFIILLGIIVMGMPMHGSYLLLYLASAMLILTALSLGLLISNVTSSQQTAMLISLMAMMLPTMIFTGFMFPIENMPLPLQFISNLVPSKWYYIIVKDIMIKGLGFSSVWKPMLILLCMATLLLTLAIKKFSIRLS